MTAARRSSWSCWCWSALAADAVPAGDLRAMAASITLLNTCSESKASMISPLSSSSNMPVISAAAA
eukprot:4126244-Lingulodinium_polyedra.AAC.1